MADFEKQLKEQLPQLNFLREEPMKNHTTFRIGGPAEYYVCPKEEEIAQILSIAKQCGTEVTVIGNGSNLLVGDGGIRGLVMEIGSEMDSVIVQKDTVRAKAGTLLSKAASAAAKAGLSGMEFAAGIPGSIGGAVTMNAGAYGSEIKDILCQVKVLTNEGKEKVLSTEELELSYRHSCVLQKGYLVLEAQFQLIAGEEEEIRKKMAELRDSRMQKQPLEYPSAGSTFKRPPGYFAGKLIMDAGLRGYTVGGAQVSEKHCGFVINRKDATASDVRRLMEDVQQRVMEKYGVLLEPEVKMIGDF